MKNRSTIARSMGAALLAALAACPALADQNQGQGNGLYAQHNLVSDGFVAADHTDTNLVNAWGIAFGFGSPVWVANNGTSTATLYNGDGVAIPLIVNVTGQDPTGIVWNGSSSFNIATNTPAKFIFVTESGTVDAWAGGGSTTVMQTVTGAVFKGVALSGNGSALQLYATDFAGAGQVDVFDGSFALVPQTANAFKDPKLPAGYNPFGIQAIGGNIYVTFAKTQVGSDDEAHGPGLGFVDVFDPSGNLLHRIASRGVLNAPWGMTLAPAGFGAFSGALLVGNFGDGTINAFDAVHGGYIGTLRGADHKAIKIDGLWGIAFGDGAQDQPVNTLFFAAGSDDEAHGLYGRIDAQGGAAGNNGDGDSQD